ncbi:MAG: glycosyltransferase family protein [Aeoliella sp.]
MHTKRRIDGPSRRALERDGGLRVALYSHDTMGLGHLRRNLLIADSLAGLPLRATNLLITGALEANFFRLPARADCLTLPRWRKDTAGGYASGQLEMTGHDLARLRASSICSALDVFAPDLVIVDKAPTGTAGELLPALEMLAERGETRIVLGLRDVLDAPEIVKQDWLSADHANTIDQFFDAIWVYGDRRIYDLISEYGMPDKVSNKVTFTGYIDQSARVGVSHASTTQLLDTFSARGPICACLVGGGQDGVSLAQAFIDALPEEGTVGVLVSGPFMPPADMRHLQSLAKQRDNVYVLDFLPEADLLIERADRVVAMAGYNTVCSLLSFEKQALLVPRTHPRREQLVRAERLAELGLIDFLHPDQVNSHALRNWLLGPTVRRPAARDHIDFGGLENINRLTRELTSKPVLNGR